MANRGWKILVGLALVVAAGLIGWTLFSEDEPGARHASGQRGFEGLEQQAPEATRQARGSRRSSNDQQTEDAAHRRSGATVIRQRVPRSDAGDAGADPPDDGGGAADAQDVVEWQDPQNRKVLGRRAWMATPSDAQSEAIEEAFDTPREQRYPIALQQRRLGVELAKDIVEGCFEQLRQRSPQARGRVSVAFDLVADGVQARFSNVEIPANLHLKDAAFEGCITSSLSKASFRTTERGSMHVEYPFLFGESDAP